MLGVRIAYPIFQKSTALKFTDPQTAVLQGFFGCIFLNWRGYFGHFLLKGPKYPRCFMERSGCDKHPETLFYN